MVEGLMVRQADIEIVTKVGEKEGVFLRKTKINQPTHILFLALSNLHKFNLFTKHQKNHENC
jgi:hypothetical protein